MQNLLNAQPLPDDFKFRFLSRLNIELKNQVQNCNPDYTGIVTFENRGAALDYKNWNGTPFTDCDALITNCP